MKTNTINAIPKSRFAVRGPQAELNESAAVLTAMFLSKTLIRKPAASVSVSSALTNATVFFKEWGTHVECLWRMYFLMNMLQVFSFVLVTDHSHLPAPNESVSKWYSRNYAIGMSSYRSVSSCGITFQFGEEFFPHYKLILFYHREWWRNVSTACLISGGALIESRTGHQIFWPRYFVDCLSPAVKFMDSFSRQVVFNLGHAYPQGGREDFLVGM
jgi:hypothetical protein